MDEVERRSRMKRSPSGKRIELSARDVEIFKLLERYRYLRSTYIHAFVGGASETRLKERLGDLFHEHYLDRPEQQWRLANCRHVPAVYELGEGGRRALREGGIGDGGPWTWLGEAHRQFSHSLMTCEVLSSIELGVRSRSDLRLVSWQEILAKAPEATQRSPAPFRIPVLASDTAHSSCDGAVVPDALFGLEYKTAGKSVYRFFALETDRGTMPVVRSNRAQSSYLKKMIAYREMVVRQIHKSHLGLPNLLVLTVTTNAAHMKRIMQQVNEHIGAHAGLLFLPFDTEGAAAMVRSPSMEFLITPWQRVGWPPLCLANLSQ
jgi:hypothetical protein